MRMYAEYEPPLDRKEAGLTLRVVGWILVVFDLLFIALFAPQSLRVGSALFVIWAVAQGIIGLLMVAEGSRMEEVSAIAEAAIVAVPPVYRPEEPRKAA